MQYGCGFAGPGGSPINEYVFSVKNQSGGPASLYNWAGYGYQYKGHAAAYQTGNFWDNVGADVVNVFC